MEKQEEIILIEKKKINLYTLKSITILILLVGCGLSILSIAFMTCFIWIPLLMMNVPLIILIFLTLKYTSLQDKI
jgi:hypothetical protein